MKKNGNGEVDQRIIDQEDQCPICLCDMFDCDEEIKDFVKSTMSKYREDKKKSKK